jgi:DNA-binding winged helix-turn-helix (wHTH) protein
MSNREKDNIDSTVSFGPYRLDPANARLWHETQPIRLTPKAFQVLCFLAARPGQLVRKDELFQAVWAETVVSEATLTSAIQEIRKALADNAREPQYVETVPKRGFRFIGEVVSDRLSVVKQTESSEQAEGLRPEANGQGLEFSIQSLESEERRPIVAGRTFDLRDGPTPSAAAGMVQP